MAQLLISVLTLATLVAASPLAKRQCGGCDIYWMSQQGDTCQSIGRLFDIPDSAVRFSNSNLTNCSVIPTGTSVCISYRAEMPSVGGACNYYVNSVSGDTCSSVADKANLLGFAIWYSNKGLNCNAIDAGTSICVPYYDDSGSAAPPRDPNYHPDCSPDPKCYSVWWSQPGDTCQSISIRVGVAEQVIADANTFTNCNSIPSNSPVCIPP